MTKESYQQIKRLGVEMAFDNWFITNLDNFDQVNQIIDNWIVEQPTDQLSILENHLKKYNNNQIRILAADFNTYLRTNIPINIHAMVNKLHDYLCAHAK